MWNEYSYPDANYYSLADIAQWAGIGGYTGGNNALPQTGVDYEETQISDVPEVEYDNYVPWIDQVVNGWPGNTTGCVNACGITDIDLNEYGALHILLRPVQSGDEIIPWDDSDDTYSIEDVQNGVTASGTYGTITPATNVYECVSEIPFEHFDTFETTTSTMYFSNCHGNDTASNTYYMGDNSNAYDYRQISVCGALDEQELYPNAPNASNYGTFLVYNANVWHC
jgi:hypothetical protein